MTFDPDRLLARREIDLPISYSEKDAILYALSIGLSRSHGDTRELAYTYEGSAGPMTLPTFATVLIPDMFPADLGWDFGKVLHCEQRLSIYRPLPPAAELKIDKRIPAIHDLGAKRGAMLYFEAEGRIAADDTAVFSCGSTLLARGDGGFGGVRGQAPTPHRVPEREPDMGCQLKTSDNQALLYRLNGDFNPLHADPAVAAKAGFKRPLLHGLCTYGIACHAILKTVLDYDYTLIAGFDARFSSPVLPGDTIATDIWQDGNVVSFECRVVERNVTVLKAGRCLLRG
jgi:acyl dehydratase